VLTVRVWLKSVPIPQNTAADSAPHRPALSEPVATNADANPPPAAVANEAHSAFAAQYCWLTNAKAIPMARPRTWRGGSVIVVFEVRHRGKTRMTKGRRVWAQSRLVMGAV